MVFSNTDGYTAAVALIEKAGWDLSSEESRKIYRHVSIVFKAFHSNDGISYQELDSIDNPEVYTEDDVVEIFIRANAG